MDKASLFWWYGYSPVETDLKHRFHGGDHGESWREGQGSGTNPHFEALIEIQEIQGQANSKLTIYN
jgi:hypothetical protein